MPQFRRTVLQRPQQCRTARLGRQGFTAKEHDARTGLSRMGKDLREVEVVREN